MWVVAHHEPRCTERRFLAPPAPPTVIGPIADLRAELATSHDLRADALTPHAGQCAVQCDGGIHLVNAIDRPAVQTREEPLGTTDRGVERHVLAGGIAIEGDVHVVNPGAGQGSSSDDRFYRVRTHRPTGMAQLIARAKEMVSGLVDPVCGNRSSWPPCLPRTASSWLP